MARDKPYRRSIADMIDNAKRELVLSSRLLSIPCYTDSCPHQKRKRRLMCQSDLICLSDLICFAASPRECPWDGADSLLSRLVPNTLCLRTGWQSYLSFTKSPEVYAHSYQIIQACVRTLVQEQRCQTA